MNSLFYFHPRVLTPLTNEPAIFLTFNVIPSSTIPPNSHHTVLIVADGLVGLPEAERGAVFVGPPPAVFEEADPHRGLCEAPLHSTVLRCRPDADQVPGQPPAVVLGPAPRLLIGHKHGAVRVVTCKYKCYSELICRCYTACLRTGSFWLSRM